MDDFKNITTSLRGVPQGGVISPILSNIYINELDVFIEGLIKDFDKGNIRINNKEYSRYRSMYNYYKNKDAELAKVYLNYTKAIRSKDPYDINYRRLKYVRYADDFIIGVISRIREAKELQDKINNFIKEYIYINVSLAKSELISASKQETKFLGVIIRVPIYKESLYTKYKRVRIGKTQLVKAKSSQGVVKLKVNILHILKKLNSGGFCTKLGVPVPRFQLYIISHKDIILMYNRVFRGIMNYYRFVDNYRIIAFSIQYILMRSCAKLLAAKFKLKTSRKVYNKFGKNLNSMRPHFI